MNPQSLLNTSQVAAWLGISTRTACLWAECSELPAIKIGRQWRFQREAVQEWLDRCRPSLMPKTETPKSEITAAAAKAAHNLSSPTL
jgi:excisionase family DNA binding protein